MSNITQTSNSKNKCTTTNENPSSKIARKIENLAERDASVTHNFSNKLTEINPVTVAKNITGTGAEKTTDKNPPNSTNKTQGEATRQSLLLKVQETKTKQKLFTDNVFEATNVGVVMEETNQSLSMDTASEKDKKQKCGTGHGVKRKRKRQSGEAGQVAQRLECVNLHCESGIGLTEAPVFVLTYYGVRYKRDVLQRVCDVCYTAAENHNVALVAMLESGEPLIRADFPPINDNVVVMDSVEELCDEEVLPREITEMIEDNFNEVMWKAMEKYKVDFQVTEASYGLKNKMDAFQDTMRSLDKQMNEVEVKLKEMTNAIYRPFLPTYRNLPAIDVTERGAKFDPVLPNEPCPKQKPKVIPERKYVLPPTVVLPTEPSDVVALAEYNVSRKILPTGPVKYTQLTAGTPVYIIRSSSFGVWLQGHVMEVITQRPSEQTLYRVKFDSYRSGYMKTVPGNLLAYTEPSELAYPVPTRVIALFKDPQGPQEGAFYVGIIAEPQKHINKFRYLVFFDDGYAQYVAHENIFPVCKASTNVCDDIHVQCREFIRHYLEQYPERPMVRLQPGQLVRTELREKWHVAKVIEVDASLVRMNFENIGHSEWIYRGSTRLKPLYDQLVMRTRSRGTSFLKKRNLPYVEYSVEQDDTTPSNTPKTTATGRNVAKKSTTSRPADKNYSMDKPLAPLQPHERAEYTSKGIIRRMDLSNRIKSQNYIPHMCQRNCVSWTNYERITSRNIPPLCKPLMVGFSRLLLRAKMKRVVIYTGPCGRKLRDMAELRTYLMTTRCALGLDLFDFDHWVRVVDEFHLEPSMYKTFIADISEGVENMAVSCVNEIFDGWPQFMKYSTRRLPQKGVNLNTDPAFMVCCDCTDDCANKKKCACWQLTLSGTAQGPEGVVDSNIGYFFRRLPEPVNTGIYECHSGCKCSKATCQNRVVQHPLMQRLQVFRTLRKGWGLRTLNDIPSGAFICIYVGRLHTEASANEGGRVYGDEYLAELDYIEVAEQIKEGYESEVLDTEDEKEDDEEAETSWERREMDKDKDFQPETHVDSKISDRSISTRASKPSENDDPNTITIVDDDEDVHRQTSKFTANVRGNTPTPKKKSLRELMGDSNEDVYIMDAKYEGNIGRYLNHSCNPNVFVQNVFVDTHDVRFPWIAFFAMSHIRAGTELTWDYNYNIGSVPEKVLYCYCGTPECRGRLL